MRVPLAALLLVALAAAGAAAAPSAQLVVALSPAPVEPARAAGARAALEARFASLGLAARGTLADGLPLPPVAPRDGARPALDPARVLLLAAPDSAAATAALAALAGAPGVAWAERNAARSVVGTLTFPDDPYFVSGRQWALENLGPQSPFGGVAGADIHARAAWRRSTGSADVMLAFADTGIDPDHPEFVAWLPDGRPRLDPGLNVTFEPGGAVVDSFGHGTAVAGVMAARTNEGAHFDSLGIAGVCGGDGVANPGCRLLPIKITDGSSGNSSSFAIARAIYYATARGARAMNLSFAGDGPSRVEREAMRWAITHGCVVVAAAGNEGYLAPTKPQYPAVYADDGLGIQVGASDPGDRRSVFSSYGRGLDLVAPGEEIWTTFMTYRSAAGALYDGYVLAAGTSFAAPHVAGVVGLLAAARPELMDTDFQHVIRESADDIGAPGVDPATGWGRLDADAALAAVAPGIGIWHDEVAADALTDLGAGTLTLGDVAGGETPRVWTGAEMFAATATVALPDSFLPPVRVWTRVGGTSTVRGGFALPDDSPWAEVTRIDPGSFALRGFLYRVPADSGGATDLPVPLDQARFGFTVIGRVDRPPTLDVTGPAPGAQLTLGDVLRVGWRASDPDTVTAVTLALADADGRAVALGTSPAAVGTWTGALPCGSVSAGPARLRVTAIDGHGPHLDRTTVEVPLTLLSAGCAGVTALGAPPPFLAAPNPFRARTWISLPGPGTLVIRDLAGRVVVRRAVGPTDVGMDWDGRDDRGNALHPGLYFARLEGGGVRRDLRLVRLE